MYSLKKSEDKKIKFLFCLKKWLNIIVAGVRGRWEGKSVDAIEGCYWGPWSLQCLNDCYLGKTGGLCNRGGETTRKGCIGEHRGEDTMWNLVVGQQGIKMGGAEVH